MYSLAMCFKNKFSEYSHMF